MGQRRVSKPTQIRHFNHYLCPKLADHRYSLAARLDGVSGGTKKLRPSLSKQLVIGKG
jgi:hypothetical protein